jgi:hypothetical protein
METNQNMKMQIMSTTYHQQKKQSGTSMHQQATQSKMLGPKQLRQKISQHGQGYQQKLYTNSSQNQMKPKKGNMKKQCQNVQSTILKIEQDKDEPVPDLGNNKDISTNANNPNTINNQ